MFYQLKVIRKDSKPPIWRRIAIPSNITFAQMAVILEGILELPASNTFAFKFTKRKQYIIEWHEDKEMPLELQYEYLHAPDTFINDWMEPKKTFTYHNGMESTPDYRVEIEKILEKISQEKNNQQIEIHYPVIMKQVASPDDSSWKDPKEVNQRMCSAYFLGNEEHTYPYVAEIREQIAQGKGISFADKMVNRDIHTNAPVNAVIEDLQDKIQRIKKEIEKLTKESLELRGKCTMESLLNRYSKQDLLDIAMEEGAKITAKRRNKIAWELARHLLNGEIMKQRLLAANEADMDAFEDLIENGPYIAEEEDWENLIIFQELYYLEEYWDGSVHVPEEVIMVYNALKENGYREYHKKIYWLLTCMRSFELIYAVAPMEILHRLYCQNKSYKTDYEEFLRLFHDIPEELNDFHVKKNLLISHNVFDGGVYRQIEKDKRPVDYYILKKEEIEWLARWSYPVYEKAYKDLQHFFIKEMRLEADLADSLSHIAFIKFSFGWMISDYVKILEDEGYGFKSEKQVNLFAKLIMKVYNETRMCNLKGHKPNEMSSLYEKDEVRKNKAKSSVLLQFPQGLQENSQSVSLKTEKKVYPNDPCPCGSGKKYKKCCGRNKGKLIKIHQ